MQGVVDEDIEDLVDGCSRSCRGDRFGRNVQRSSSLGDTVRPSLDCLTRSHIELHGRRRRHRVASESEQMSNRAVDTGQVGERKLDNTRPVA